MKKILFYFSLILHANFSYCEVIQDSLVLFNDLSFKTEKDAIAFRNFVSKRNDNLLILLPETSDKNEETKRILAETKISESIAILTKKISGKSDEEKVNTIVKYVHKNFLKTFKQKNNFSEILESGIYNNLSEMTLYQIILGKLSIPFEIKEEGNSISIITYPASSKIKIKSIETEKQYYIFSDHFKKKFSLSLYYNHAIAHEELDNKSDEILFDKFYFSQTPLTIETLTSLHFKNHSLTLLDEKKTDDALAEIKKCYLLSPSTTNQFTLKYILLNSLGSENYTSKNDVDKLELLCRFKNKKDPEITSEFIIAEHQRLLNVYTTFKNVNKIYDAYHLQILNAINDAELKKELEYNYNFSLARMLMANELEHQLIIKHLQKAYLAKPQDKDLHSTILQNFSSEIMKIGDSEGVLTLISEYSLKFDFVTKTSPMMRVKANCLLDLAFKNFNKGLMNIGIENLEESAKTCQSIGITPDEIYVEKAYLEAARNYYIAGNRDKAKEFLNKGLMLAPQSIKIKERLKMVN